MNAKSFQGCLCLRISQYTHSVIECQEIWKYIVLLLLFIDLSKWFIVDGHAVQQITLLTPSAALTRMSVHDIKGNGWWLFTVMGLISALNDLAVMSEKSQLIIHQGSILFTNIIYNSFDCWQSSANTSQAKFYQCWRGAQLQHAKPPHVVACKHRWGGMPLPLAFTKMASTDRAANLLNIPMDWKFSVFIASTLNFIGSSVSHKDFG